MKYEYCHYIPRDINVAGFNNEYSFDLLGQLTAEPPYFGTYEKQKLNPRRQHSRSKKQLNYKLPEHLDYIGTKMKWKGKIK